MSVESINPIRQFDFAGGPNYSDSPFTLAENELAQTDNMMVEQGIRVIPGATAIVTTVYSGTPRITGVYSYGRASGNKYFMIATSNGKVAYENSGSWTEIGTNLSTTANTFYSWATFNNTLALVNGVDAPKKWDTATFSSIGGSPPTSKFISVHGDYVLLAGHTSNPSQIRYSNTSVLNTWPVGNVLNVGLDDGQVLTGLRKLGDVTICFKDRSIWQLSGSTPTTFKLEPTLSDLGCIAPHTVVLTDLGILFWSEAGPALFNGYKSVYLGKRIRTILDGVNWAPTALKKFNAVYYPYRKQVLMSYVRSGQTHPDRMLIIDLYHPRNDSPPFPIWPILYGATSSGQAEDTAGRLRAYLGISTGYTLAWDSGTTWNGTTIVGRARTRHYHLGKPDQVKGTRTIDLWIGATAGNLVARYAADGTTTFTTHGQSSVSMANSGKDIKFIRLDGDGSGNYIVGRTLQMELTNATTGFTLLGLEVGPELLGRRND